MGITIKTGEEIEILRKGGKKLAEILKKVTDAARPGVSYLELDGLAERLIFESGGEPAFKGYRSKNDSSPFPATLCVSVDDCVVHGVPSDLKIKNNEVLKLDIGMRWPAGPRGLFTDTATTLVIGSFPKNIANLAKSTKRALMIGIDQARAGARVGDIGSAVEKYLIGRGIGIVRDLAGHGVGYKVHEDPLIPNYGNAGVGPKLEKNMVLALEVMTTLGDGRVNLAKDGWGYKSADGSMSAHFEHTIAVTGKEAEVLTA